MNSLVYSWIRSVDSGLHTFVYFVLKKYPTDMSWSTQNPDWNSNSELCEPSLRSLPACMYKQTIFCNNSWDTVTDAPQIYNIYLSCPQGHSEVFCTLYFRWMLRIRIIGNRIRSSYVWAELEKRGLFLCNSWTSKSLVRLSKFRTSIL